MRIADSLQIEQFMYHLDSGWDVTEFPDLDSTRTLIFAFGCRELENDDTPLRQLQEAYPTSYFIGCSTAGEISGCRLTDRSLSVAAIRFKHTDIVSASAPIRDSSDSYRAGEQIANQLHRPNLRAVFVLSDGINVNGSELIRGIASHLPEGTLVSGGLAGDGADFQSTWVFQGNECRTGMISAIGLYGDKLQIGHGSKGGWDVFGPERVVTRSSGNVLYELDGQPALPLYKKYLGDLASQLPSSALHFPLALRCDDDAHDSLVRTILAINEDDQSLTFAGDIPQGQLAKLMRANFDRLIDGAAESARLTTLTSASQSPCLCIAISCVGRRIVLGPRTEEELESVAASLPPESAIVGYYSYGEISPHASGSCDLHNQTMTLTTLAEAP